MNRVCLKGAQSVGFFLPVEPVSRASDRLVLECVPQYTAHGIWHIALYTQAKITGSAGFDRSSPAKPGGDKPLHLIAAKQNRRISLWTVPLVGIDSTLPGP